MGVAGCHHRRWGRYRRRHCHRNRRRCYLYTISVLAECRSLYQMNRRPSRLPVHSLSQRVNHGKKKTGQHVCQYLTPKQ